MSEMQIRPVTNTIGAEIHGVDLSKPLEVSVREEIEQALYDHHVLFFREQDISPEDHIAFARQFGELADQPFATRYGDDSPIVVLDQDNPRGEGADEWHSDNSFMAEPPMGSVLRAIMLPEVGGDTCWANMIAAYEALSAPIRRLIDGLTAVHDVTKPLLKGIAAGHTNVKLEEIQAKWPPVEHPVARTHPVTGRKALYVNRNSTTHIVGLSERENEALLPMLMDHVRSPDFQCRFSWDTRSVVFWDNRSAAHFAVPDYHSRRVMNRVTIAGDRPR